jgi:hypothetical protein
MEDKETYVVEFSKAEINQLAEVLKHYRGHYDEDPKKLERPVYIAGCELSRKIGEVLAPGSNIPVEEYY